MDDNEKLKSKNQQRELLKKRVYLFVLDVVKLIDILPKDSSTQIIAHQLLRAATSIAANYIEAQAASSKKDFTNFFHHALKSCNETKFWLALLRDTHKTEKDAVNNLLEEAKEISKILGKSIITLKSK